MAYGPLGGTTGSLGWMSPLVDCWLSALGLSVALREGGEQVRCFQRLKKDFPRHPSIRMKIPPSKIIQAPDSVAVEKLMWVPQSVGWLVLYIVKLPIVREIKLVLIKRAPALILAALIRSFILVLCQ
jgi:hypothetical protein